MIYTYCITIAYLIKNTTNPNRAQDAFDMAYKESESFDSQYEYADLKGI